MIYINAIIVEFEDKTEALVASHNGPSTTLTKPYYSAEDDTLFSIAHKEFQDTNRWHDIAILNPEIDPIVIPINTLLNIPLL